MKKPFATLDRYLSEAQDNIHAAIGLCQDNKITGFTDLLLTIGELQQMRYRLKELSK